MESRMQTESRTDETRTAEKLVSDLKAMVQRAEEKVLDRAKAADRVVREHPYPTMGLAFGVGLLLGFLSRRK